MTIPLTGNPPGFLCPHCQRRIYGVRSQIGMALLNTCAHYFELHQDGDGKLSAVFAEVK